MTKRKKKPLNSLASNPRIKKAMLEASDAGQSADEWARFLNGERPKGESKKTEREEI